MEIKKIINRATKEEINPDSFRSLSTTYMIEDFCEGTLFVSELNNWERIVKEEF